MRIALLIAVACTGSWSPNLMADCRTAETSGLPSYQLGRWAALDGAPADIWALTQSDDDMLWLGTGSGLYRFDGQSFARVAEPLGKPLTGNITALAYAPNGALWIGYFTGGVSVMRNGWLEHFPVGAVMPRGMVYAIAADPAGRTWVATNAGLAVHDGQRWLSANEFGYPADRADWVLADHGGNVWAATGEELLILPAGGQYFARTGIGTTRHAVLAQGPDDQVWLSDAQFGTRPVGRNGTMPAVGFPVELAHVHAKRLWFSNDGVLWGTDARCGGIFYATPAPAAQAPGYLQRFGAREGLTADVAVPGLVDREGNIWIGTNLGLNRLRRRSILAPPMQPLRVSEYSWSLGQDGKLYAESDGVMYGLEERGMVRNRPLAESASLLAMDGNAIWAIDRARVLQFRAGSQQAFPLPDAARWEHVLAFTLHDHQPFLSLAGHGLYALQAGQWVRHDVGRPDAPVAMASAEDALWLGFADGRIQRWLPGQQRRYGAGDGLQAGAIMAMAAHGHDLLVAGEQGLAWLSGERFHTLLGERLGGLSGVTGIAVDADDAVWLNTIKGAIRVSREELDRAFAAPGEGVAYRIFDGQDGMPGVAIQASPVPTALATPDRVWLATNGGLAWVSRSSIQSNTHRPNSMILGVRGNGTAYPLKADLRMPAGTTSLQVDFTAPSLSSSQGVRFRYRLEGLEEGWHESSARQALYSNLRPGKYRFIVTAANNDGLWSEKPAVLAATLAPAFWQSAWFTILCVASVLAALALLHWRRMQQMAERMRIRVAERYLERERIARELHDTLLQGLQGLILRLGSVAMQLPRDAHRRALENALVRAEELLVESRDHVSDLRSEPCRNEDLETAFRRIGEEMQPDNTTRLVVVSGKRIRLAPAAYDDIHRIGQEAILNAYRHAQARQIMVTLDYRPRRFVLHVQDDGIGLDRGKIDKQGHWGLSGIRERARRLNAALRIRGNPGTHVELIVPAKRAYGRPTALKSLCLRLFGKRPADHVLRG
ncbi:MAG: triple tyrosine motif-containing protein [Pseudoxanthomonas sp.]